jgi:hypothetical protein
VRAASGRVKRVDYALGNPITLLEAEQPAEDAPVGGGFLEIVHVTALKEIAAWATSIHQTVTHFGFTPDELQALFEALPFDAVRRFVPIGEALSFDAIWDGYDLTRELCRFCKFS